MLNRTLHSICLLIVPLVLAACGTTPIYKGYDDSRLSTRKDLAVVALKDVCTDIANKPCEPSVCLRDADIFLARLYNANREKELVVWDHVGVTSHKYRYMLLKPGEYAVGIQAYLGTALRNKEIMGTVRSKAITKSILQARYGFAYVQLFAEANGVYQLDCNKDNGIEFKKMPFGYSSLEWVDHGFDSQYSEK